MKPLDFRKVGLHEAFQTRLAEGFELTRQINSAMEQTSIELSVDIRKGTNELNWADLGSLAHAVEQLEEAAAALGIEVPVDPSSN